MGYFPDMMSYMNAILKNKELVTYEQLLGVATQASDEPLVDLRTYDKSIIAEYEKQDMLPYTGERILVRDTVAQKLAAVNKRLEADGLLLRVVYGYRHPEVQEKYFSGAIERLKSSEPELSEEELRGKAHNFVAVPEVAGHPSGGAVDLTLVRRSGEALDMGTKIADYTDPERIQTYALGLTEEQRANRDLLLAAMLAEGFAPFLGEWWHFSFGDREWAFFHGEPHALYDSIRQV